MPIVTVNKPAYRFGLYRAILIDDNGKIHASDIDVVFVSDSMDEVVNEVVEQYSSVVDGMVFYDDVEYVQYTTIRPSEVVYTKIGESGWKNTITRYKVNYLYYIGKGNDLLMNEYFKNEFDPITYTKDDE